MGRWDKKETIYGDDRSNLPSDNELEHLKRLNEMALFDIDNYDKLGGDGEFERLNGIREFLKHPKEMRKLLRKKKQVKPKSKRKCKCK